MAPVLELTETDPWLGAVVTVTVEGTRVSGLLAWSLASTLIVTAFPAAVAATSSLATGGGVEPLGTTRASSASTIRFMRGLRGGRPALRGPAPRNFQRRAN